jgi:hypothetical protein
MASFVLRKGGTDEFFQQLLRHCLDTFEANAEGLREDGHLHLQGTGSPRVVMRCS